MAFIGLILFVPLVFLIPVLLTEILIPRKAAYRALDKIGAVTNCVLALLYPMIWYITLWTTLTPMMAYDHGPLPLLYLIAGIGLVVPIASIAGVILSIVFRKKGESRKSFLWQFAGVAVFGLQLAVYFIGSLLV